MLNLIEPGIRLIPNTVKLIHCRQCGATWADRKIPKYCPNCGVDRKKIVGAKQDDCESFMEAYLEMLEENTVEEFPEQISEDDEDILHDFSIEENISCAASSDYSCCKASQDPLEELFETAYTCYDPIGYDPSDYENSMIHSKRISVSERKELLGAAEAEIKEAKQLLQSAGLPSDLLRSIFQDIKTSAADLGKNIPAYTEFMIKKAVDMTLQRELMHPKKNRQYSISDVERMLKTLGIRESLLESYMNVAGCLPESGGKPL